MQKFKEVDEVIRWYPTQFNVDDCNSISKYYFESDNEYIDEFKRRKIIKLIIL